jgi:perosamine synthetase
VVEILERRRAVADEYRRRLSDIDGLELPLHECEDADLSWFVYVVRVKGLTRAGRDEVLNALRSEGVGCNNYFAPLHLMPHLRRLGYEEGDFPVTEAVAASTVALPFFTRMRRDQIARVSDALRRVLSRLGVPASRPPRRRAAVGGRRAQPSPARIRPWRAVP